jgi:dihydrolipoamide dehydrogenase
LSAHIGDVLNEPMDETALALGYFLALAVWLAFEHAHGTQIEHVSAESIAATQELMGLDEELRRGDPAEALDTDDIVIATGSVPTELPGFPFDEETVWSSTGALVPNRIPEHLVVIGGGYIGLELGMMYAKIGSKVTVVEATGGALPGQERDCVKVIERSLKKMKIELLTETFARGFEVRGRETHVRVEGKQGERTLVCDQILSTVGRRPFSDGLGLEHVGLVVDERGFLPVDARRRTRVENVYAIGDIAGQPMLAHKGSREGLVAAAVIAGQPEEYDARCVPAVTLLPIFAYIMPSSSPM